MKDFLPQVKVPSEWLQISHYSVQLNGHRLELHDNLSREASLKRISGFERALPYLHSPAKCELNLCGEGMDYLASLGQIPSCQKPPSSHPGECQKQLVLSICPVNGNITIITIPITEQVLL